jgi:transposase
MEKFQFVVGVDVSKKTLDVCLMSSEDASVCSYCQVSNNLKGYFKLLAWVNKHKMNLTDGLFLLEHTGIYSLIFSLFLKKQNLTYTLIPGIVLKQSLGICRGKNDKKDAYAIAKYGYLYRREIILCPLKDETLLEVQVLFSQRKRLVNALKGLKVSVKEMQDIGLEQMAVRVENNQIQVISSLKISIANIEKQIIELVEKDPELARQYELCKSIPGVGMQLTTYLLIITHAFTRFDNSRKLASYAGVAPFPYQSGTSIKGKNRTSPMGDKMLKSLLHMAALNAVRLDNELKIYYERKKQENKNAMLVLNSVKNKLIARIIATVNRGTPYVQLQKHLA